MPASSSKVPDPEEIERIRGRVRADDIFALDDVSGRAMRIGAALTSGLTLEDVDAWPDLAQSVTAEDVKAAATTVLRIENSVTGWLMPPDAARSGRCAVIRALVVALALAFAAGASTARAEFNIVSVTSPGGIEAWLYEEHTIPILTIDASFLGGPAVDPAGREGTTSLMAVLLDEGAGELDSTAFATAREDLAAEIGFSASDDDVQLSATMLTETRDATVDLLRLALTEPRFDPEPVERLRAQTLASIRMGEADPQTRADAAFYSQAFPGHPYGRLAAGTEASVGAMTVDDLRAAHKAALTRAHLRVAVVGDITPRELGPLLDRALRRAARDGAGASRRGRAAAVGRDHCDRLRHAAVGGGLRRRRDPAMMIPTS